MAEALYGPGGFFVRPGNHPIDHFRTSALASPLFAGALATLAVRLDDALGHPDPFDLVDVGAGRGELVTGILDALPASLACRVRANAVELAPRPDDLQAGVAWTAEPPPAVTGLLVASEWLDNVPVDVAVRCDDGTIRYVEVDRDGTERPGAPVDGADAGWLARWWPLPAAGARAEIGRTRDEAWTRVSSTVERGLALAVDYGHVRDRRPLLGSLTGFRAGREVAPVPDGTTDVTAAVALDSLGVHLTVLEQAAALRALGVDGGRPPLALASQDPRAYVRALARAGQAVELTDPAGLGGHFWVMRWV